MTTTDDSVETTESEATGPTETTEDEPDESSAPTSTGLLENPQDISLAVADEYGQYYTFWYGDEQFLAYHEPDCWKVYDSYRITNPHDIVIICQALTSEHEVHGSDGDSVRTSQDMAQEWLQHNVAYAHAPEGSSWRERAKNVDLDADGQSKGLMELLEEESSDVEG
ncbi:MAG: hypothetical protein Q4A01_06205 [Coriobacteriales bacterium]|nr:hypothetical protein [Coriobacteriales bacterium]